MEKLRNFPLFWLEIGFKRNVKNELNTSRYFSLVLETKLTEWVHNNAYHNVKNKVLHVKSSCLLLSVWLRVWVMWKSGNDDWPAAGPGGLPGASRWARTVQKWFTERVDFKSCTVNFEALIPFAINSWTWNYTGILHFQNWTVTGRTVL